MFRDQDGSTRSTYLAHYLGPLTSWVIEKFGILKNLFDPVPYMIEPVDLDGLTGFHLFDSLA